MARHLITSALPYINGVKHLGNLVGSMLPADVYARFRRLEGHEVLLICATDEHGTPAELAAADAGQDVADYCAEQYEVQSALGERFRLSWDWYGRTSRPQNHELTQHFARALQKEGYLEVRTTRQVYSITDGRFLPDRYVIGTCPNCAYERARGDQCENCTKPLDPTDLVEPRSAISGSTDLEVRETAHLYLLQSRVADRIRTWIDTKAVPIEQGGWPPVVTGTAYKWLDEGLQDRGITRDLSWGVPVPADTFPELEGKVFYVWFDAPIGYIAATKEWADDEPATRDWESWWRSDRGAEDVTYTEFMGKDNVPFHTLSFPATILGSGEPWKLVDQLKGFNYLNYEGGKFSTSLGRGVFMDDALALLPADYWRWYLIANAPESSDTNFTWELFGDSVNKDLVGTFGNFVNRTATQVNRHFGEVVPEGGEPEEVEAAFRARVGELLGEHIDCFDRLEFRKAAAALRALWAEGNVYLEQREPWRSIKVDVDRTACTLRHALWLCGVAAVVSASVVPDASATLAASFAGRVDGLRLHRDLLDDVAAALPAGTSFAPPGLLFRKLESETLEEWESRFSGTATGG